ncbi:uncharacterized protein LOC135392821 isoform X1 [Ornithodoros turicata]|uniref:uncharacterized protein LOC135392821 isoform X1 n=1 Tax=Ornithodoros turicata TaxID=34597 RepID=UPI00313971DF
MSYPVTNTEELTFKQMQTLVGIRSARGIHMLLTNPFISTKVKSGGDISAKVKPGGELFLYELPRGVMNGTVITAVLCSPQLVVMSKYRLRCDRNTTGDGIGHYLEFYIHKDALGSFQRDGTDHAATMKWKTSNKKTPRVMQVHVEDDGTNKAYCDGDFIKDLALKNFGSNFIYHTIDHNFDPMMVMEFHITYKSDSNMVFNTSEDFKMPELPLSSGAYLVWEGNATGTFTVTYKSTQIYRATKSAPGLRLVMEMFITTILIGLEGEEPTCVANPKITGAATNYKHPLVLSKGFQLTNFIMQTGSRSGKE